MAWRGILQKLVLKEWLEDMRLFKKNEYICNRNPAFDLKINDNGTESQ